MTVTSGFRKLGAILITVLLVTSLVSGCSSTAVVHPNTLTIAGTQDLDTALWTQSSMWLMDQLLTIMGEPLVYVQPDGSVQPALADSWEISTDDLVYTFHLNPNAKWQDGQPVTAQDVAFTIEQTIYPECPSGGGPSLLLVGASDFGAKKTKTVEGISILDDHTIRLTFAVKSGQVLSVLAADAILPYHILGSVALDEMAQAPFNTMPIYCGPYKMTNWVKGSEIDFERFDGFFGPKAPFDKIIYRVISEPATAINELKAGNVDVIMNVPVDSYDSLVATEGIAGIETQGPMGYHLMLNQNNATWKNLKVRQAVSHAIDWNPILNNLYLGKGMVSTSLFHPANWEYDKNLKPYDYNVQEAKQLLSEVGWTDANGDGFMEAKNVSGVKDGTKLTAIMPVTSAEMQNVSLILKQQLQQVGIDVTVEMVDSSTFYSSIYAANSKKWDLMVMGWGNSFIGAWPSSRGMEEEFGGVNTLEHQREGYNDPELAAMIDQVEGMSDNAEAKPLWDQIQQRIYDNVYWVNGFRPDRFVAYNSNLNGDTSQKLWDVMWYKFARTAEWSVAK